MFNFGRKKINEEKNADNYSADTVLFFLLIQCDVLQIDQVTEI